MEESFLRRALLSMNKKDKRIDSFEYLLSLPDDIKIRSMLDLGRAFGSDEFRDKLFLAVYAAYKNAEISAKDKDDSQKVANRVAENFFDFWWRSIGQQIYQMMKNIDKLDPEIARELDAQLKTLKPRRKMKNE